MTLILYVLSVVVCIIALIFRIAIEEDGEAAFAMLFCGLLWSFIPGVNILLMVFMADEIYQALK